MFWKKLIRLIFIIKMFIYFYTYIVLLNSVNPALVLGAKIQKKKQDRDSSCFSGVCILRKKGQYPEKQVNLKLKVVILSFHEKFLKCGPRPIGGCLETLPGSSIGCYTYFLNNIQICFLYCVDICTNDTKQWWAKLLVLSINQGNTQLHQ